MDAANPYLIRSKPINFNNYWSRLDAPQSDYEVGEYVHFRIGDSYVCILGDKRTEFIDHATPLLIKSKIFDDDNQQWLYKVGVKFTPREQGPKPAWISHDDYQLMTLIIQENNLSHFASTEKAAILKYESYECELKHGLLPEGKETDLIRDALIRPGHTYTKP